MRNCCATPPRSRRTTADAAQAGICDPCLRYAGRVLSGRSAGIYQRLEAGDGGQPRRHLRPHRPDRAAAPGGAAWSTIWVCRCATRISGAWTNGCWTAKRWQKTIRSRLPAPTANSASTAFDRRWRCRRKICTFPTADTAAYEASWKGVRCAVMQGGQGEVKHWAFNDPVRRQGAYQDAAAHPAGVSAARTRGRGTASADAYSERAHIRRRQHPAGSDARAHRRARTDLAGGKGLDLASGPPRQPLRHAADRPDDRPQRIADAAVPMSLLADHPNVQFNFYRGGIGTCETEMH